MMSLMSMPHLPIVLLALVAGFAIGTGGICVVRAAHEAAHGRYAQLACTFLAALSAAVALLLARMGGFTAGVEYVPAGMLATCGALVFAAGARINGACAIGTVERLASGELAYLGTLAGALAAATLFAGPSGTVTGPPAALPQQAAWCAVLAILTLAAMLWLRRRESLAAWPSFAVVGFTGALLAASKAHWAWIDVLRDLARRTPVAPMPLIAGGALFLGAAAAAAWRHRLRLRWPTPARLARDFAGGAMMMAGGIMIPGGNDSLVLYGLPGASPRSIFAWIVMFAALWASFRIPRQRARVRPTGMGF